MTHYKRAYRKCNFCEMWSLFANYQQQQQKGPASVHSSLVPRLSNIQRNVCGKPGYEAMSTAQSV